MSIIIAKPEGVSFDKNKVNGHIIYSDPVSINYVYAKDGKLHYKKNKNFDVRIWDELKALKKYPVLIYINEGTGLFKIKKSWWSPLFVNKDIAIIGSGELNSSCRLDSGFLKHFICKYLKPIIKKMPKFLFTDAGEWMMEQFISFEAAIIAINSKGEARIFNQKYGEIIHKMWVFDSFTHSIEYQTQTELEPTQRGIYTSLD